jgi:DNA-directed RNA polymerase specialized sigma24 family protein
VLELADELVQAARERALQRFHQWVPGTRLDSWLYTIMHSVWCNEIRSRRVRQGAGRVDPDQLVDAGVESQLGAPLTFMNESGVAVAGISGPFCFWCARKGTPTRKPSKPWTCPSGR